MPRMKTFYYSDPLNDDFASSKDKITPIVVDDKYKYEHKSFVYKLCSFILYRIIATPIAFVITKLIYGLRIKNKKVLRKIKGGYFLYGNHTNALSDVFSPSMACFPRAVKIVANPNGVSIPVVGKITPMLGALPLPSTLSATKNFLRAMKNSLNKGNVIMIYPEAHIWPYYNEIRPFADSSFAYPIKFDAPVVAFAVTYRKRKIFKKLPPLITLTLSDAFYPKDFASKTELRNAVCDFMTDTVKTEGSVAYHNYVYKEKTNEDCNSL